MNEQNKAINTATTAEASPRATLYQKVVNSKEFASLVGEAMIKETKQFRVNLDKILQDLKSGACISEERKVAILKIKEAIMWLGMDLKSLGEAYPYPNSYNPNNATVDPTSQGLKL